MRLDRSVPRLTGFALLFLLFQALPAQEVPVSIRSGSGGTVAAVLSGGAGARGCSDKDPAGRSIEPYTATRKTTEMQKLANGVTITRESTGAMARDSSGRSYHKDQPSIMSGGDTQIPDMFFFNVNDPVSRISIHWTSNSREATVFHFPQPGKMVPSSAPAQSAPAHMPEFKPVQTKMVSEDLGTKTINGLDARGTRTTKTYPAGSIGNDQPLVVTSEEWESTELGIEVLRIDDDPRTGVRTTELTDIERGDPDPALFQAPEGYTVKDQNPERPN
jgi:hypothetical protein